MGKINEYQRKQIASTTVGVAGRDRSAEIIGGGITKLAAAIVKKEVKQQDMYSDIQANKDIMDVSLSLQNVASQLQIEYAANPAAYPEKFLEEGQKVVTNAATAIQDPDVRGKFITGANTLLRAGVNQAPVWSKAKKKDNATIAGKGAIKTGTLAVGTALNKEQLVHNINTVKEMAFSTEMNEVLDVKETETFLKDNMPGVLDTYFINKIRQNAKLIKKELEDGTYDNVEFFTREMRDKYIAKAETRIKAVRAENIRLQTENFGIFQNDFLEGNLNTARVDAMWENRNTAVANSITTGQRAKLMSAHIKRVDLEAGKVKAAHFVSGGFIDLVYSVFDDRVEQAEVLEKVIDVWADNFVSKDELKYLTNLKVSALQYQEATDTGGWFVGVKIITARAKRYWSGTRAESEEVKALNLLVKKGMSGLSPGVGTQVVLNEMDKAKAIENDSSLAIAEDPLEAAYKKRALEYLQSKGLSTEDKHVENVAKQIKVGESK